MRVDDVHLADYFAGLHRDDIEVGKVDTAIAVALQSKTGTPIWLSDYTLTKQEFKHTEITYRDYLDLPEIIRAGFVVPAPVKHQARIYMLLPDRNKDRGYRACLKHTADRKVYIDSFHRMHPREVTRIYRQAVRKNVLIRDIANELARYTRYRAKDA